MITSYETGAVFRLIDEASPAMRAISERLMGLEKLIGRVQGAMRGLNEGKVGSLAGGLTNISEKLTTIGTKAEGIGAKVRAGFQGADGAIVESGRKLTGYGNSFTGVEEKAAAAMSGVAGSVGKADAAINTTTEAAGRLATELRAAGTAARDIPRLPGAGGGSGGNRTPGSGGGGRHPRPGRPQGTDEHGNWKEVGVNLGMGGFIGFEAVAHAMEHMVEAGAKLEHFQSQFLAATGSQVAVQQATAAAWEETSKNLQTNVSDNMKNIQHLKAITGALPEAIHMLHPFTLMDASLASVKDDTLKGEITKGGEMNTYNAALALEQLGVTSDPEKLESYTAGITRMFIGMRGLVDGSKLLNAIQNSGAAKGGYDEEFVESGLGPIIQATKNRGGAQLYQLYRSAYQGVGTQTMFQGAEKYGLWGEQDEHWVDGHFKGMNVGSVFESKLLAKDPLKWAGDVREMMRKRGVNVDDQQTMMDVVSESTRGNKNFGSIMEELILPNQYKGLIRERKNITDVQSDAAEVLQKTDPGVAMREFRNQWENLLTALGKPAVPLAAEAMKNLAGGFNVMARWAEENPGKVKLLLEGFTGISVALGVLTAVGVVTALAMFGPGGVLAAGIVGLVSVLGTFAAFNWDSLADEAGKMGLSMDNFHRNFGELSKAVIEINDFGNRLGDAILGMINGLFDKLRAIPGMNAVLGPAKGTEEFGPPMPPALPETHEQTAWRLQHRGQSLPTREAFDFGQAPTSSLLLAPPLPPVLQKAFGPNLPSGWHPANDNQSIIEDRLTRSRASIMHADTMDDGLARMRAGMIDMPSAHAAEAATIPGLNPSGATRQASTAIAGRLGMPAGIDMSGAIERATGSLGLLQKQEELNIWQFGQLTDTTGIVKASFDGLNTRATGITGALASFSAALDAATAKVYGLFGGGAGAGDVGGGSGFTNAAYTTWDSPGGGSGGGAGAGRSMPSIRYGRPHNAAGGSLVDGPVGRFSGGGTFAQKSPEVMSRLMRDFSLDVPMAAKIMGNIGHESMGFRAFNEIGGGGGIGWPQWTGSRNREFRAWSAANNLDIHSDEANYGFLKHELKGKYARGIEYLKHGGSLEGFEQIFEGAGVKNYGSRHAYERAALDAYSHRGATVSAGRPAATVSAPPPRKVSPGVPAGGNMTTAMNDARPQQHHIYLDGKKIAQVVTKHQASAMRFPGNMGGPDPHSHYVSPGTPVSDAA